MDREGYYFLQKSSSKTQEARDCCEIFMASYWLAAVKLINSTHLHWMGSCPSPSLALSHFVYTTNFFFFHLNFVDAEQIKVEAFLVKVSRCPACSGAS